MSLTALQLGRLIADAVLAVAPHPMYRNTPDANDVPTQAVLRTMREHSVWFCALKQDADGIIDGDAAQVQLPLEIEP